MKNLVRSIGIVVGLVIASSCLDAGSSYGLKIGATLPQWKMTYDDRDTVTLNSLNDFSICGVVSFPLTKYISLQIEPTYAREEFSLEYQKAVLQRLTTTQFPTTLPNTLSFTQDFVNLNCPVLLKMSPMAEGIRPYLLAGVMAGINLSATSTANFDTTNMNLKEPIEIKPDASAMAFGLQAGAGIQIPLLASLNIVADARYNLALNDAASLSAFNTALGSVKASHIVIFAGATFEF